MEKIEKNIYYVYRHIRLDKKTPFYIGKGSGNRAFQKKSRNKYWKSIASAGYKIEIILSNLTQEEAYENEIKFIKLYKTYGFCEANFTHGGEGALGYKAEESTIKYRAILFKGERNHMFGKKRSEEAKRITSEKVKGKNNPMYGKKRSEDVCKKISKTRKERGHGCKAVICTNTGIVYQSATHAANVLKLHATSIVRVCKKKLKNTGNLNFEYFKLN